MAESSIKAWQDLHSFQPSKRATHNSPAPLEDYSRFLSAWETWPEGGIDVHADRLPLHVSCSQKLVDIPFVVPIYGF